MSKADFDHIYCAPDPRAYFQTLGGLDYQIPAHGASVFAPLADHVGDTRNCDPVHIVDLCCSYGVNAAVMKHRASFTDIVGHYTDPACADLDRDALLRRDRAFFEPQRDERGLEFLGLDVSEAAIDYGVDAGFLDAGFAEDLEANDPSPNLAALLKSTDLVTITGGVGYITEQTVGRILDAAPTPPWIAALCLRWVDFDPIAEAAVERDMVVHRIEEATFPQRRFADLEERDFVISELDRLGRGPDDHEADGYHHAELFVIHPGDEPPTTPIAELLASAIDAPGGG